MAERLGHCGSKWVQHIAEAERPKLSDGGHETCRLQTRRPAAVRCSAWLGHTVIVTRDPKLRVCASDSDGMDDAWEIFHFGTPAVATLLTDADGDGFSDNHEYRAGTDPRSKLQFTSAVPSGHNGLVLEWEGVAGRVYRLNATTSLTVGFASLISDILAVPGLMRVTNTLPANISQLYYRLEVQSP